MEPEAQSYSSEAPARKIEIAAIGRYRWAIKGKCNRSPLRGEAKASEDGGARADAEGEGYDGDRGEAGIPQKFSADERELGAEGKHTRCGGEAYSVRRGSIDDQTTSRLGKWKARSRS